MGSHDDSTAIINLLKKKNQISHVMFLSYANNKDADQSAHQRSLISAFVVRCLDNIIPLLAIAEISRP